jgi:hypothetical protein
MRRTGDLDAEERVAICGKTVCPGLTLLHTVTRYVAAPKNVPKMF